MVVVMVLVRGIIGGIFTTTTIFSFLFGSFSFRVRQSGRTDDARVIKATDASALPNECTTLALVGDPMKGTRG